MKNKIVHLILTICLLGSLNLSGQIKKADFFFGQFEYSKAIPLYKKAAESKDDKIRKEATVRLADCYRYMNNASEASAWYAKAVTFEGINPESYYYLGLSLRSLARYDEAQKAFNVYAAKNPSDLRGKIYEQYCRDIKSWEGLSTCAEIKNASQLNSQYSDFGTMFYKNGLIITSDRDLDLLAEKNYLWTSFGYLDLYLSNPITIGDFWADLSIPVKLPTTFNQSFHDGPASFTNDFKVIATTRTLKSSSKRDSENFRTNLLKIYLSDLSNEKKISYQPFPFNSEDYSVGHPALSADGKKLIFSSDKPSGIGQSDLYISELVGGKWSEPVNLGAKLNTFGNEVFPFLANDSTLFFSSDGHPGYGGLDIYEARLVKGQWSSPWNLKLPINSPYDDFSIVFNKDLSDGFFSSNRQGGKGSDDIYAFRNYKRTPAIEVKPVLPKKIIATISGYVKDKKTQAPLDSATVFLHNTKNNEILVLKTDAKGYFEAPSDSGAFYIVKGMKNGFFDDCLSFSVPEGKKALPINVPRDLFLDKYAINQVFKIENIYYDLNKWNIREDARPSLDDLVRILKQYPINVELGSHTDARASFKYNNELSQKRAEAAVRYLTFSGINSMRLTAKGYGETKLVNKCADGITCTEAEHQANRRTEFKITAIDSNKSDKKEFNPNVFKAGDKIPVQLLDSEFFNGCLNNKSTAENSSSAPKPEYKKNVANAPEVAKKPEPTLPVSSAVACSEKISYTVQLAAATNPIKNVAANFKGEKSIQEKKIGAYFKYFTGSFDDLSQATAAQKRLKAKFPEAFVVAFKGGKPIPLNQVLKN